MSAQDDQRGASQHPAKKDTAAQQHPGAAHDPNAPEIDSWVTYRPELKVLDCTIRDGGLVNDHAFDYAFVKGFPDSKAGPWKFCTEDDLRRIVGDRPEGIKLSVMADAERCDYHTDILPRDQSVLSVIRVACYVHQVPTALDMIKDAHDKGYQTTFNLMALSTVQERDLFDALEVVAPASS